MDARAVILLMVMLLFVANAHAIGISPSRVILNFTPAAQYDMKVTIINNENRSLPVQVYVRGDLAEFVRFSNALTTTISPKSVVEFPYKFTMPDSLAGPNKYDTRIGAVESASGSGMLGAVAGVEAQLWVNAPPGEGWSPTPVQQPEQPQVNQTIPTQPSEEVAQLVIGPSFIGTAFVICGAALGIAVIAAFICIKAAPKKRRK